MLQPQRGLDAVQYRFDDMIQTPLTNIFQRCNDTFQQGLDNVPAVFIHCFIPPCYNAVPRRFDDAPDQFTDTGKGNTNPVHQCITQTVPVYVADKGCDIVTDCLPICIKHELIDTVNDAFQTITDVLSVLGPINSRKHIIHAGCESASELRPVYACKGSPNQIFQIGDPVTDCPSQ